MDGIRFLKETGIQEKLKAHIRLSFALKTCMQGENYLKSFQFFHSNTFIEKQKLQG